MITSERVRKTKTVGYRNDDWPHVLMRVRFSPRFSARCSPAVWRARGTVQSTKEKRTRIFQRPRKRRGKRDISPKRFYVYAFSSVFCSTGRGEKLIPQIVRAFSGFIIPRLFRFDNIVVNAVQLRLTRTLVARFGIFWSSHTMTKGGRCGVSTVL